MKSAFLGPLALITVLISTVANSVELTFDFTIGLSEL